MPGWRRLAPIDLPNSGTGEKRGVMRPKRGGPGKGRKEWEKKERKEREKRPRSTTKQFFFKKNQPTNKQTNRNENKEKKRQVAMLHVKIARTHAMFCTTALRYVR